MTRTACAALGLGLLLASADAADRTLYWRALDVTARLDREGRLHVRERHAMVFTGAWNGGERRFRVERGQRLELERLSRLDPSTGTSRSLTPGDLSRVDQYKWFDSKTLRWRSRLPSAPPFRESEIVYEIDYSLSGILVPQGDRYLLHHDFAFPDRPGPIRRFTLDFQWDPAWEAEGSFSGQMARQDLLPGRSIVVALPLRFVTAGTPGEVMQPAAPALRYIAVALLLAFVVWRAAAFHRHEKRLGRYGPLVPVGQIDDAWLRKNVFELRPELVGATWDKTTSAPEVAAVLARLTAEGKLKGEVRKARSLFRSRDVLHLTLLCDRNVFLDYERKLINALFFAGNSTDTDRIRRHYRQSGFSPAEEIRSPLLQRMKELARGSTPAPSRALALGLFAAGMVLGGIGLVKGADPAPVAIAALLGSVTYAVSRVWAMRYDRQLERAGWFSLLLLLPMLAIAGALGYLVVTEVLVLGPWVIAGLVLLCMGMSNSLFNAMRTRDTLEFMLMRKRLASARRYFREQLASRSPRLEDAWLPYLLAFGLGPHVDRWFRVHGGADARNHGMTSGTGPGLSTGSAGTTWTGGGGSFGGGGATASWAAAVGAVAAGVTAVSSGSGGSGGGGGGSSGGGGGGGW